MKLKKTYLELPKLFYMKLKVNVRLTEKRHFKLEFPNWYLESFKSVLCLFVCQFFCLFFFLSNSKEPGCTQKYTTRKRCAHVDHDFDFLAQFRITCTYCMEKHINADETQDWSRGALCACYGFMKGALKSDVLTN